MSQLSSPQAEQLKQDLQELHTALNTIESAIKKFADHVEQFDPDCDVITSGVPGVNSLRYFKDAATDCMNEIEDDQNER